MESVKRILSGELVVGAKQAAENTFCLTVDYSQTVEEMRAAGGYDQENSGITSEHFPHSRTRGKTEVEVVIVHLRRAMSNAEIDQCLADQNLRDAELPELLAFGAHPTCKDEQRKGPIAARGSVWRVLRGNRHVACLHGSAGHRELSLLWIGDDWRERWRFLAVRKPA
ncbi:MAG: hypothetical protein UY23_C0003G0037 [Candidatus Jorgensenbacteria bacterium GW2011_GWA1_48_11]|uniref:Uncharacterized protein n=1 Tax=Candidatus Jorgensenbacteria bacterium GW2011_GWA1_48_11 TaxID=1618660 RepID=A0A0G1UAP9_9BACT|nr:MAG: hypothetical protein UY23_C0003G0037 [Candidatus Jorgensenbacteria bacterium GW2011_GWA1_48_11]KKW11876.1 MAG: hypothetical protein UY51_C0005G0117 [Candidatus Jorgensenbacteria bacterium GW2011_GWB1_49_9]